MSFTFRKKRNKLSRNNVVTSVFFCSWVHYACGGFFNWTGLCSYPAWRDAITVKSIPQNPAIYCGCELLDKHKVDHTFYIFLLIFFSLSLNLIKSVPTRLLGQVCFAGCLSSTDFLVYWPRPECMWKIHYCWRILNSLPNLHRLLSCLWAETLKSNLNVIASWGLLKLTCICIYFMQHMTNWCSMILFEASLT